MIGRPPQDPWDRYWDKVAVTPSCWLWWASCNTHGYGQFYIKGEDGLEKNVPAHRQAYRWLVGEVPVGLCIDHLCRVRRCVNPDHMEIVTLRENTLRGFDHRMGRQPLEDRWAA